MSAHVIASTDYQAPHDYAAPTHPGLVIRIIPSPPNGYATPAGRLCEAELIFGAPLQGLRLTGFGVWERHSPTGRRNVTFPARTYSVNGERRSFALLRPVDTRDYEGVAVAQDRLRDAIVYAFELFEQFNR